MPDRDKTSPDARPGLLLCLSYYLPNVSGLTLAAAEAARFVAARGHQVRVLTSRPRGHPPCERIDGIEVRRAITLGRIGKAPLMPLLAWQAWRAMDGMGAVAIQLPNADAALLAVIARLRRRQVLLHYHCSLSTATFTDRILRAATALPHLVAGALARSIQVVSEDYAAQSVFCRLFRHKLQFAPPPVPEVMLRPLPRPDHRPDGPLRVAYVGRLARQKSLPLLLAAFDGLADLLGQPVELTLIGPAEGVVGEDGWRGILKEAQASGGAVRYLGTMTLMDLRSFYGTVDLLVLPSTDRQESFGLVQVEAMVQGVPAVAFDLPGLRVPIQTTGMGKLAPRPGSTEDLRRAMAAVLQNGRGTPVDPASLQRKFGPDVTCAPYLRMLQQ